MKPARRRISRRIIMLRRESRVSHRVNSLFARSVLFARTALAAAQHTRPSIACGGAELLLDADELVVLGEAVGARERAGLDLPAIGRDGEIGDRRILGLARAVR